MAYNSNGDNESNFTQKAIIRFRSNWIWKWSEQESKLDIIPNSKTARLSEQAKLANVDAEKAISRAYNSEVQRIKAIGEALYKSGKAVRLSFASSSRQIILRMETLKRQLLSVNRK